MVFVAIVYEDGNAVRAFRDRACLNKAYRWAHHHYCLADIQMPAHKLPEYLDIKLHMMSEEQFKELVK